MGLPFYFWGLECESLIAFVVYKRKTRDAHCTPMRHEQLDDDRLSSLYRGGLHASGNRAHGWPETCVCTSLSPPQSGADTLCTALSETRTPKRLRAQSRTLVLSSLLLGSHRVKARSKSCDHWARWKALKSPDGNMYPSNVRGITSVPTVRAFCMHLDSSSAFLMRV